MPYSISDLADVTAAAAARLRELGVTSTDQLLQQARTTSDRAALAERIGASSQQVLAWANEAELLQLTQLGPRYTQLLEAAGVESLGELASRNAELLTARIAEINAELGLSERLPTTGEVAGWIEAARRQSPVVGP